MHWSLWVDKVGLDGSVVVRWVDVFIIVDVAAAVPLSIERHKRNTRVSGSHPERHAIDIVLLSTLYIKSHIFWLQPKQPCDPTAPPHTKKVVAQPITVHINPIPHEKWLKIRHHVIVSCRRFRSSFSLLFLQLHLVCIPLRICAGWVVPSVLSQHKAWKSYVSLYPIGERIAMQNRFSSEWKSI